MRHWPRWTGARRTLHLLLNPTRLEDVLAIARSGERMPRKSTYFYPKPVSGLVFYPMEPGGGVADGA